jgi:hypothetical protein
MLQSPNHVRDVQGVAVVLRRPGATRGQRAELDFRVQDCGQLVEVLASGRVGERTAEQWAVSTVVAVVFGGYLTGLAVGGWRAVSS